MMMLDGQAANLRVTDRERHTANLPSLGWISRPVIMMRGGCHDDIAFCMVLVYVREAAPMSFNIRMNWHMYGEVQGLR